MENFLHRMCTIGRTLPLWLVTSSEVERLCIPRCFKFDNPNAAQQQLNFGEGEKARPDAFARV